MCLAAVCVMGVPAAAQQTFGPSVEGSVGLRYGSGGHYMNRAGAAVDVLATMPVARVAGGTVVGGLTGGVSGAMASELVCVADPQFACVPGFPTFVSVAALAGVQRSLGSGSLRVLVGPGYYQAVDGPDVLGMQARIDVATPRFWRVSLIGSARTNVLPDYQNDVVRLNTFGIGLRIH